MAENKKATYISGSKNLSLGIKSAFYRDEKGQRTLVPGERVRFEEGVYETDSAELQAIMEKRPEFGTLFIRVPDGESEKQTKERMRPMEEKDKEIAKLKAETERLQKLLSKEEGGRSGEDGKTTDVSLDGMKRDELVEIAKELEIAPELYRVGIKNEDIKALILKAREEQKNTEGAAFEE